MLTLRLSSHYAAAVVWIFLAVVVPWGTSDASLLDSTGYNPLQGMRLAKLKTISRRLDPPKTKRSYDDDFDIRRIIKLLEMLRPPDSSSEEEHKRTIQDELDKELELARRQANAMASLQTSYATFHGILTAFVNELAQMYIPGTAAELQIVKAIPDALQPNFQISDEDALVRRINLVIELTNLVLKKIPTVVRDDAQTWLKDQSDLLNFFIADLELALGQIRIGDGQDEPAEDLPSGIGGINKGPSEYSGIDAEVLKDLQKLYTALNEIR